MKKYRGKVKWFSDEKGYGFLARDNVVEDLGEKKGVFVHYDAIATMEGITRRTLVKDQIVDFFVVTSEKGMKALQVTYVALESESEQGAKDAGT